MYFCERQTGESVFFLCCGVVVCWCCGVFCFAKLNTTTRQHYETTTLKHHNTKSPKILFFAYNPRSLQSILPKCIFLNKVLLGNSPYLIENQSIECGIIFLAKKNI